VSRRIWSRNPNLNRFLRSDDNAMDLFSFDGIYTVDYRDRFLFLMLGTFFPHKRLGTSIIDQSPTFFYGERPNNIIRKIEKEKKYYGYVIFFIHLTFFPHLS
jgi:hypothetical protein